MSSQQKKMMYQKKTKKKQDNLKKEIRKIEVNGVNKTINSDTQSIISTQAPTVNSQNQKVDKSVDKSLLDKRSPNKQDRFPAPPSKKVNVERKTVRHDAKKASDSKNHTSRSNFYKK